MKFDQSFLEQVRAGVGIVEVVSQYVNLRRSGRDYAGLCPFHGEKTPSFYVSESKQIFKCFGCGQGGDVFKFVSLIENLSFPEAVESLAERAGIQIPRPQIVDSPEARQRRTLLEVMEKAQQFFRQQLGASVANQAQTYLGNRKIGPETIESFGLGYAPSGNVLLSQLRKLGIGEADALACGLIKQGSGHQLYDRFRDRVIFPIKDLNGRVIAFGGRILGDGTPKYLNSPETPLYNKSSHLFGLHLTRDAIRRKGFAILVEGYFDCIVPYQYGFQNVVASLGTSLTDKQVKLLGRYTRNVVVNYDPDRAGMSAAVRSISLFLEHGLRVNVVRLPRGIDPDSFLRESGAAAYQELLKSSSSAIDFVLGHFIAEEKNPGSPKGKRDLVDLIAPFLLKMPDRIERSEYISRVASRLQIDEVELRRELRRVSGVQKGRAEDPALPRRGAGLMAVTPAEMTLLAAVLENPETISWLDPEIFVGLRTESIFQKVLELRELKKEISIISLRDSVESDDEVHLLETVALKDNGSSPSEEEVRQNVQALRKKRYLQVCRQIQNEIKEEESQDSGSSRIPELLARKESIRRKMELDLQS